MILVQEQIPGYQIQTPQKLNNIPALKDWEKPDAATQPTAATVP
jgi:hypothetical protein